MDISRTCNSCRNEFKQVLFAGLTKDQYTSRETSTTYKVKFKNLHDDSVRLYWLDFRGNLKFFGLLKQSKAAALGLEITTFVTHPWIALHKNGEILSINFKRVFRPISMQDFTQEACCEDTLRRIPSSPNSNEPENETASNDEITGKTINAYITPSVLKLEVFCCIKVCKLMSDEELRKTSISSSIVERILTIKDKWMI